MLNILVQTCESMEIGAVTHYIATNRALQTWDPVENPDLELRGDLLAILAFVPAVIFFL